MYKTLFLSALYSGIDHFFSNIFVSLMALFIIKASNIIHFDLFFNNKYIFLIYLMLNIAKIRKEWFVEQLENLKSRGIPYTEIAKHLEIKPQYLNLIKNTERGASEKLTLKLCKAFNINHNDLLIQISKLQNHISEINEESSENIGCKIPNTILNPKIKQKANKILNVLSDTKSKEWIDTGELFPDATSVIRHYGDSMPEYPSGSILILKHMMSMDLIIWGRNYFIETTEMSFTKRLQDGGNDYIIGYSSNMKTYPDGRFIHEPVKIPKKNILGIHLVLGCIIKEFSESMLPSFSQIV